MVVKSLLISGNLPENGITFCYKPQSRQKPGFPRMSSLCAAEHQSACSAGCQGVKQKTRSGKARKPRGGGAGWTEPSSRSAGWTRPGCGAAGVSGEVHWSCGLCLQVPVATSALPHAWGTRLSPLCCLYEAMLSASQPPDPQGTAGTAAPTRLSRWRLGWHSQPEGLRVMLCLQAQWQGGFAKHINCWKLPGSLMKSVLGTLSS